MVDKKLSQQLLVQPMSHVSQLIWKASALKYQRLLLVQREAGLNCPECASTPLEAVQPAQQERKTRTNQNTKQTYTLTHTPWSAGGV
jgi:hypothetical protein